VAWQLLMPIFPLEVPYGKLKDVADVHFDYKDEEYLARFNGKRAVTANQKEDTNIFRIFGNIKAKVSEFEKQLPESMTLHYVFDQSKSVADNVKKFGSNLIQGMIIVGVVVFLSLRSYSCTFGCTTTNENESIFKGGSSENN